MVTAFDGAWDLPAYEFDRSRFLEHTAENLRSKYANLDSKTIEELKSYPTLFAYEGTDKPLKVGHIRHVKERSHSTLLIEYDFDEDIKPFNFSQIESIQNDLDISKYEMQRTHWALKDEDLFKILSSLGLVNPSYVGEGRPAGRVEEIGFKVALSFPGEKRDYVSQVASELKKILGPGTVFYDMDFKAQLARPNLDNLLQRIYITNSELVVVFLCEEYEQKKWCGIEWRAIKNIIYNKNDEALMFMRFDKADVSGVFDTDGYVDLEDVTPKQAARLIAERVWSNEM